MENIEHHTKETDDKVVDSPCRDDDYVSRLKKIQKYAYILWSNSSTTNYIERK